MENRFDELSKDWDKPAAVERAVTIAQSIKETIDLSSVKTVLDVGCGTGLLGLNFIDCEEVSFLDNSAGMLDQVKQKFSNQNITNGKILHNVAFEELPQQYDTIISLMTLHHIPDYKGALQTLINKLNYGGYLCIADLDKEDGSFHKGLGHKDIHNGFDRAHIEELFSQFGLTEIHTNSPYTVTKEVEGVAKEYPLFLICGKK